MKLVILWRENNMLSPRMKLFITGTDTHVGKTYISVGILTACNKLGMSTLAIKPVASGCVERNKKLYSDDAIQLQQASSLQLPYAQINPFAFQPAIAPHLAAKQIACELNVKKLSQQCSTALTAPVDLCLVEGVGGWLVPLNNHETMADFVLQQKLAVILVVGIKLGCINHSILTYQAMQRAGAKVLGWIANCLEADKQQAQETIQALHAWLPIPCLAVIPHHGRVEQIVSVKYFQGLMPSLE